MSGVIIDKFYMLCTDDEDVKRLDPYWVEMKEPVKIMVHRGFHFAVHNNGTDEEPDWRVSEIISGQSIVTGMMSKDAAKDLARRRFDEKQEVAMNNLYHSIETNGVSPRFTNKRRIKSS